MAISVRIGMAGYWIVLAFAQVGTKTTKAIGMFLFCFTKAKFLQLYAYDMVSNCQIAKFWICKTFYLISTTDNRIVLFCFIAIID
jgi:hypothetical protein